MSWMRTPPTNGQLFSKVGHQSSAFPVILPEGGALYAQWAEQAYLKGRWRRPSAHSMYLYTFLTSPGSAPDRKDCQPSRMIRLASLPPLPRYWVRPELVFQLGAKFMAMVFRQKPRVWASSPRPPVSRPCFRTPSAPLRYTFRGLHKFPRGYI